ncbi:MAG: hypothetical protein J5850_05020 [Clostridia bacterium]|nr:hypothetical protein [Clostridia bacterium]
MKKYISIILTAVMLLSFFGCSEDRPSQQTTTEVPPAFTTPKQTIPEDPVIDYHFDSRTNVKSDDIGIISYDTDYDITDDKDNVVMFVSMTLPIVEYVKKDETEQAVADIIAGVENGFKKTIEDRSKKYAADIKSGYKFTCTPSFLVSYVITDFSTNYVSILYTIHETNAEGILILDSVCLVIDLKGGFAIDLTTLFTGEALMNFIDDVNKKFKEKEYSYFKNYESRVSEIVTNCWLLYEGGVMILVPPYVISPGYYGYIDISFTNSEIVNYFSDYGRLILGGK